MSNKVMFNNIIGKDNAEFRNNPTWGLLFE